MRHFLKLAVLAAFGTTGAVLAQDALPVLVTDLAMCAMIERGDDVQESGMILTTTGFSEIEYSCEFESPITFDWSVDQTLIRPGYCAEPGLITPLVFVIELPDYEPGTVFIWQQGNQEPTRFTACPRG